MVLREGFLGGLVPDLARSSLGRFYRRLLIYLAALGLVGDRRGQLLTIPNYGGFELARSVVVGFMRQPLGAARLLRKVVVVPDRVLRRWVNRNFDGIGSGSRRTLPRFNWLFSRGAIASQILCILYAAA